MAKLVFQDGIPDEYGVKAEIVNNLDGTISFKDRTNWVATPTPHNAVNMNLLLQKDDISQFVKQEDITNTVSLRGIFANPYYFMVYKTNKIITVQYHQSLHLYEHPLGAETIMDGLPVNPSHIAVYVGDYTASHTVYMLPKTGVLTINFLNSQLSSPFGFSFSYIMS